MIEMLRLKELAKEAKRLADELAEKEAFERKMMEIEEEKERVGEGEAKEGDVEKKEPVIQVEEVKEPEATADA